MKKEVSKTEYMDMIDKITPFYPVLRMITEQNIPFEKWGDNIVKMVDEKLGVTKREIIEIESDKEVMTQEDVVSAVLIVLLSRMKSEYETLKINNGISKDQLKGYKYAIDDLDIFIKGK